jgi:hypothetical protein
MIETPGRAAGRRTGAVGAAPAGAGGPVAPAAAEVS